MEYFDKKICINGEMFYDVKTFAVLTNRSTQSVYRLISEGNSIRKLRCVRFYGKPMIPIQELKDYPFCTSGPWARKNTYTFASVAQEIEDHEKEAMNATTKADV